MADIRCDKCGASWEWDLDAEICPNCGFLANPVQATGESKTVDDLFDQEETSTSGSSQGGEVARLKTRQSSNSVRAVDEGRGGAEKIGGQPGDDGEDAPGDPGGDAPEAQGDDAPRDQEDEPKEDQMDDPAGAQGGEKVEEGTDDPGETLAEDAPSDQEDSSSTSDSTSEASDSSDSNDDDGLNNTVELEAMDVEVTEDPQKPPPPPRAVSAAEGDDAPPAGPLRKRNTLELDQADLMEVAVDSTPPQMPPTIPDASDEKHIIPGRVAYPIRDDKTPLPSTLPKDVDELAVAGRPPAPHQRSRPLKSQTEQLAAMRARKRKRSTYFWMIVLLVGLCALGAWKVLFSGSSPRRSVSQPEARALAQPDSRSAGKPVSAPDAALRDQAPADTMLAEQGIPDHGWVDTRRRRAVQRRAPVPRKARATPPPRNPRPAKVSPAASPATTALKGNARDLYRQGILLMMRGNSKGAVSAFKAALKKNKKFSLAYRGLGLAYQRLNKRAMARASFQRYLILNSQAPDAEAIQKRIKSLR